MNDIDLSEVEYSDPKPSKGKKIRNFLFNIILPGKCMFCDRIMPMRSDDGYCVECFAKLPFKTEHRCLICQREIDGAGDIKLCRICKNNKIKFDANFAPFNYSGRVEDALKRFKFDSRPWYGKYFAAFMYEEIRNRKISPEVIVYPPVNRKTYTERGYNQSEILAKHLGRMMEIPVVKDGIYKLRENEKQSRQSFKTRFSNVKGVFAVDKEKEKFISGKRVLFTDDILTTGATASECAGVLKKSGAVSVISVTAATVK